MNEYREKHQNVDMYKRMLEQRSQLPVFQYKSRLIETIKKNRVVVVKGATGCGKTTQVYKHYYRGRLVFCCSLESCLCSSPRRGFGGEACLGEKRVWGRSVGSFSEQQLVIELITT